MNNAFKGTTMKFVLLVLFAFLVPSVHAQSTAQTFGGYVLESINPAAPNGVAAQYMTDCRRAAALANAVLVKATPMQTVKTLHHCSQDVTTIYTPPAAPTLPKTSALVSWQPPTMNTDGTPLTNLEGFRVSWGQAPNSYSSNLHTTALKVQIDNLTAGTWYFTVQAINTNGVVGPMTTEQSKVIVP